MISYIVNNIGEKKLGEKARYFIEFLDENPEVALLELLGHKRICNKTKVFKINFKYKDIEEVGGNKYVTGTLIELVDIEKELQKIINKNKLNYYKYLKNMGLFFKFSEDFIIKNLKNIMMTTYFTENRMISKLMVEEYIDDMKLSQYAIGNLYNKLGVEFMDKYFTKIILHLPKSNADDTIIESSPYYERRQKIPCPPGYHKTWRDIERDNVVYIETELTADDSNMLDNLENNETEIESDLMKPSFSLRGLGITPESILTNGEDKFDIDGTAHRINKLVEKQMDEKEKTYVVDCLSNLYDSVSNENKSEEDK